MACVTLQHELFFISLVAHFTAQQIIAAGILRVLSQHGVAGWCYFLGFVA
jgi:hypothetical protein